MERRRIDALLADRGLAGSRTSAAASVRAGRVRIGRDGRRASKPSELVPHDAELLLDEEPRYVSRGGLKLERGLDALGVDVGGAPVWTWALPLEGSRIACYGGARRE